MTVPTSWVCAQLGAIANVEMGQSPDSSTYNDSKQGLPFFQGKAEFGKRSPIARKWCTSPRKVAEPGDILLSIRAPVGPLNVADVQCAIGRGLAAIAPLSGVNGSYLVHALRHLEPQLASKATGTTFAAVGGEVVRGLDVPLAPTLEQKRIADKLDTVLSRVDAVNARLARVAPILKRFRQSVLAAATSGRLTEDWRLAQGLKQGTETTLRAICMPDRVITYGVVKLGDETPGGTPCLRTSNVRWLRFELDGMKLIDPNLSAEYGRTVLRGGEVLVNVRGTLGGVAVAAGDMAGWNVSREVAVVPVDQALACPIYISLWIASDECQRWLTGVTKGVAYTGINIEDLRALPLKLPLREEQAEIVRRVEALFAFATRLEARLQAAQTTTERLTPSLLAKAFRGELVPQDPNDEPASELLKRLAAANTAPATPRRRGRAPKAA